MKRGTISQAPPPAAAAVITGLVLALACPPAVAVDFAGALRKIAKVADDVPISKLDDVASEAASSRFARELVEKAGVRFDDVADRARMVRKMLTESAEGLPPAIVKQIDTLDGPTQETLAVLARGSRKIGAAIPDVAERSRLIREGGANALLVLGRYEDLADDALKVSTAARAGALPKPGGGSLSLGDFSDFFLQQGDRAKRFWDKSVKPHWKLWTGSAALAAVMASPDEYLDQFGELLHGGASKIARVGGKALGIALGVAAEGVQQTLWEVFKVFVSHPLGATITAVLGLLALGGLERPIRGLGRLVAALVSPLVGRRRRRGRS